MWQVLLHRGHRTILVIARIILMRIRLLFCEFLLHRVIQSVSSIVVSRSEEHTSELQSRFDLVCRLLLEAHAYHLNIILFPYTTLFRSYCLMNTFKNGIASLTYVAGSSASWSSNHSCDSENNPDANKVAIL